MTQLFAECPYCGHEMHTATEVEHHVCEQNTLTDRIDTLEYLRADAVRRFNVASAQNAELLNAAEGGLSLLKTTITERDKLRAQNAELLAALKDCREELEQYESRLSGEDYSNPTLNALIQRAEGN